MPLWSWLRRRGRCRHCGVWIGWQPLLAELAGAGIAALAWATLPAPAAALATLVGWWLLLLALIDAAHGRLPDVLTLPLLLLGLAVAAAAPLPGLPSLLASGLGAALGFGLLYLVDRLYAATLVTRPIAVEEHIPRVERAAAVDACPIVRDFVTKVSAEQDQQIA